MNITVYISLPLNALLRECKIEAFRSVAESHLDQSMSKYYYIKLK